MRSAMNTQPSARGLLLLAPMTRIRCTVGPDSANAWKEFVQRVRRAADSDAGFVIIDGFPASEDGYLLSALGRSLGAISRTDARLLGPKGTYSIAARKNGGLRDENGLLIYSTTRREFPCHTDPYRNRRPADLLVMQSIRRDERGGGRTILFKLRDLLARLTAREIAVLIKRDFPTSFGKTAVISDGAEGL